MITKVKFVLLFTLILIGFSTSVFSMGLFGLFSKKENIIIFGGMQGQILLNGEPAAGAQIKLWTKWNSPEGDTLIVKTDEKGQFELPEQTGQYRPSAFAQLVISQQITVNYQRNEYLIWNFSSFNPLDEGSLGYQPQNLTCELSDEREPYEEGAITLITSCHWTGSEPLPHS